ncbi:MAG: hypothetical protein ACRD4X_17345 [Candidatus Acidiferrales bacterium]
MVAIGGMMAWKGADFFLHGFSTGPTPQNAPSVANASPSAHAAQWQQDVLRKFDGAAQQAKSGAPIAAEVQVDEAAAEMEDARIQSQIAASDFFSRASDELDGILKAKTGSDTSSARDDAQSTERGLPQDAANGRLFEHVTQARIELAIIRSAQQPLPPGIDFASDADARAGNTAAKSPPTSDPADSIASPVDLPADPPLNPKLSLPAGHVAIESPRTLAANDLLNPTTFGGNFLDATLLPDMAEILLPPETRAFSDDVRVENLTIAGGSQTLDGIHWHNVTFIDARLRYEDGPLDLQSVQFVRCTFGFPSDARGAKIANAIALGQTTLFIQ